MKYFNTADLEQMDSKYRLNLINALPGIKSANLIGTKSPSGLENLAIFSSVLHLGSHPPLMGFVMRPIRDAARHTYQNILESGYFTINQVAENFMEKAHYTSANFPDGVSEFETCGLTSEYLNDFHAPYVKESPIKMGLKYLESHFIAANETIFMVGQVQQIYVEESCLLPNGYLDLSLVQVVGLSGLNSYYHLDKITDFPYARVNEVPKFK